MGNATRTAIAYTDGSCRGNPGPGAWAYRIEWPDGRIAESAEPTAWTTNNREELKAVKEVLACFSTTVGDDLQWKLIIYSDSLGVINWVQKKWKRNKNRDILSDIDDLYDSRIEFKHVRGHSGHPGNERVDQLATEAADQLVRSE